MSALSASVRRFSGPSALRVLLALAVSALVAGATTTLQAATITGNTYDLRLLGHVRNASGTVLSTEGYIASPVFNVTSTNLTNNVVPGPIPPLNQPNTLRVDESEAAGTMIIWIRGPLSDPTDTFANILDPNFNVELEFAFVFDNVPANKKVVIEDVRPEQTGDFYNEVSYSQSGLGIPGDPLRLLILLDPEDVQQSISSHVKVHIDFDDNMDRPVIPEPVTAALALVGLVGWAATSRRDRC
jgi:hypothetical protein